MVRDVRKTVQTRISYDEAPLSAIPGWQLQQRRITGIFFFTTIVIYFLRYLQCSWLCVNYLKITVGEHGGRGKQYGVWEQDIGRQSRST